MINDRHDRVLLMIGLAQVRSRWEILRIFRESLASIYPALSFSYGSSGDRGGDSDSGRDREGAASDAQSSHHENGPVPKPSARRSPGSERFPVQTMHRRFTDLWVHWEENELSEEVRADITNLTALLAVILENRVQAEEYEDLNAILREDTERKGRLLDHITQSLPIIVYLFDMESETNVFVNSSVSEILGYSSYDAAVKAPKFLPSILHPDDVPAVQAHHERLRVADVGERFNIEYRVRAADGGWRWLLSTESPYTKNGGRTRLMIGTAFDITERKRNEAELEDRMRQRAALLREVNHRVKNNLAIVSDLLGEKAARSRNRRFSDLVAVSRKRLESLAIVHEQLYSQDNLVQVKLVPYLRRLLQNIDGGTHAPVRVLLSDRSSALSLSVDDTVVVGLIVNELVNNALEHAYRGGETGTVMLTVQGREENQLSFLEVSDDGGGFRRRPVWRRTDALGLDLVRNLARQLDMELVVGTSSQGGTAVRLTRLERRPTAPPPPGVVVAPKRNGTPRTVLPANPRVFVVEDELILVLGLKRWLADHGFTFVGNAGTAEDALEMIPAAEPDIIVMDIRIRGAYDGLEVAARLGISAVFVFQTGYNVAEISHRVPDGITEFEVVSKFELQPALMRVKERFSSSRPES